MKSKWKILHEGHLLPVASMFDMFGVRTNNPLHAFGCFVYKGDLKISGVPDDAGDYFSVQCHPGDIWVQE